MDHTLTTFDRSPHLIRFVARRCPGTLVLLAWMMLGMGGLGLSVTHGGPPAMPMHNSHARETSSAGDVVSLDICTDGAALHLLVGIKDAEGISRLEHLRSDDDGVHWSTPAAVSPAGQGIASHRGSDARIAAFGDHLVAVWTTVDPQGAFGSGPLASALSDDSGKTWQPGPMPSVDSSKPHQGQGFIGLSADVAGAFHMAWLDSRTGKQGVIYARSTDFGRSWTTQVLVPRSCECCWNTVTAGPDGRIAVLYRAHDPRDMRMVQSVDHGRSWTEPVTVGRFDWQINACPHCGGGCVFTQPHPDGPLHAHAAVWTGAQQPGGPGVFVLRSLDGGKQWEPPRRIGDATAFRPDLKAAPDGRLVVAFEARREGRPAIFAASSSDHGESWSDPVALSMPDASATHPRVAWSGQRLVVFWTQRIGTGAVSWSCHPAPESASGTEPIARD